MGPERAHADDMPCNKGRMVWILRLVYLVALSASYGASERLQKCTDDLWRYLATSRVFTSVYFETWWVIVCYPVILAVPFIISKLSAFDRYKIEETVQWRGTCLRQSLYEVVEYGGPLMVLDSLIVKKYDDVDPAQWEIRRRDWFQTSRALPETAPSLAQVVWQLLASLVIYDAIFYVVHRLLHSNATLYERVHALHHTHDVVCSRVTNRLSIIERLVLVLSANFSLKLVHAHPLTRTLFVPVFVCWLIGNHCGYDLPWSFDKVLPSGVIISSAEHYRHHVSGTRSYQPFFSYIDNFMANRDKFKSQ